MPDSASENTGSVPELVAALGSKRGLERQAARLSLVKIGEPAGPALIEALTDENKHRRWEAAKALGAICSPQAAPALVDALVDESTKVRWLAAEALIALERAALQPLLKALTVDFDSIWLRNGAHHVLHGLERSGQLRAAEVELLDALRDIEPESTVPFLAQSALAALDADGS